MTCQKRLAVTAFLNATLFKNSFSNIWDAVFDITEEKKLAHPVWDVFTFGTPPVAIDIMVNLEAVDFDATFKKAVYFEDDELKIRTINRNDLIAAKKIAGSAKDINDLENLK